MTLASEDLRSSASQLRQLNHNNLVALRRGMLYYGEHFSHPTRHKWYGRTRGLRMTTVAQRPSPASFRQIFAEEQQVIGAHLVAFQQATNDASDSGNFVSELDLTETADTAKSRDCSRAQDGPKVPVFPRASIGLALSGGGVRAATFALGVLEGMSQIDISLPNAAKQDDLKADAFDPAQLEHVKKTQGKLWFLDAIDYISSVSGGGYINAWFAQQITLFGYRKTRDSLRNPSDSAVSAVADVRNYGSYLTPQRGILSGDTWRMIGNYLIRLLPNQLFLSFGLAFFILLPYQMRNWAVYLSNSPSALGIALAFIAPLVLILAHGVAAFNTSSQVLLKPLARFFLFLAFSMGIPVSAWASERSLSGLVLCSASIALITQTGVAVWAYRRLPSGSSGLIVGAFVSSLLACASATFGALWLVGKLWSMPRYGAAVAIGPALFTLCDLVVSSAWTYWIPLSDENQDYVSELWGATALLSGIWALVTFVCYICPHYAMWLLHLHGQVPASSNGLKLTAIVGSLGTIAGSLSSVFYDDGKEATPVRAESNRAQQKRNSSSNRMRSRLASAAPYLVLLSMLVLAAMAGRPLLAVLRRHTASWLTLSLLELLALFVCLIIALLVSWRMDANRLSMHNFYRARLTAAYLASSADSPIDENPVLLKNVKDAGEKSDPISDIRSRETADTLNPVDCRDSNEGEPSQIAKTQRGDAELGVLPTSSVQTQSNRVRPYPIFNCAMNVTSTKDLSVQSIRSRNFIFSPLYCGFHAHRKDAKSRLMNEGYRCTEGYLGKRRTFSLRNEKKQCVGITLAEPMTISGAAGNPAMGFHTSPALSLLLSLFNVRLGAWVGNPRNRTAWEKVPSDKAPLLLLKDYLAQTGDQSEYLMLSDGGHFENTGVYELIRRRCRVIFCCDSGADPGYLFGDLLHLIERCRVDFGVTIDIPDMKNLKPFGRSGYARAKFAIGTILYPENLDSKSSLPNLTIGTLVVLKPAVTRSSCDSIRSFDLAHASFPQVSTADQWFYESEFEAYRLLGIEAVSDLWKALGELANDHSSNHCGLKADIACWAREAMQ